MLLAITGDSHFAPLAHLHCDEHAVPAHVSLGGALQGDFFPGKPRTGCRASDCHLISIESHAIPSRQRESTMKIYKYWTTEKQMILIDGVEQQITCYGGSNSSIADAQLKAKEKAEKIKRKIKGEKHLFDEYESEIREEILEIIDDHAAITRNRYGAQVLNTEKLLILDIDKPRSTFTDIFRKKDAAQDKLKIFDMVRKLAFTSKYQDYGFRIYETYQGARVIVLGKDFDPRDRETSKMMNEFNCDGLYMTLCHKQNCFRARLTPKPYRMKMRRYKVQYPREEVDAALRQWLADYERESRNFSVCKFIEQAGARHSLNNVVQLHDEITGTNFRQPLA
jgi:hypothetical protein